MKHIISGSIIFMVLILVISCQQENIITEEDAKLLCDKIEKMYSDTATETVNEILDSAYMLYSPLFPSAARGTDTFAYNIKSNLRSFPDFSLTIDSFFVKGDIIYSYWTKKGTNTGPLGRMPTTGKAINYSGFTLSRIKNGKIIEEHTYWNVLEFYKQLGFQVIPPATEK